MNQYTNAKEIFSQAAPTVTKTAEKALQHPKIAEYMAKDGMKPFTGINTIW